jgi:hypothetical protein
MKNLFEHFITIATAMIILISYANASPLPGCTSLRDQIVSFGTHRGARLIDVIESYRVPGTNIQIPLRAVQDAFEFFDNYCATTRTYQYFELVQDDKSSLAFGPIAIATKPTIGNHDYMIIFDLDLHSSTQRLHIINLQTGEVESVEAAHGSESDCGGRQAGFVCEFISDRDSKASLLGFFTTDDLYREKTRWAIRLNGLEGSSDAFSGNDVPSTIVIHSAAYVSPRHAGLSHGCPALNRAVLEKWKDKLKDGALFYFYHTLLNKRKAIPSGIK